MDHRKLNSTIMNKPMNRQIYFVKRPSGMVDESVFALRTIPMPAPGDGQILLHTRYISVDPYMRGRMNDRRSYVAPFQLNEAVSGGVVAEVVESKSKTFSKGDFVAGTLPWQDYSVAGEKELRKIDPSVAPVSTALGVLGMPGLTAYFGLLDIGKPRPGETVVVSGAAGAVGTVVGQIAKIKGCRVVGIAGSDKKVKYLTEELGFDVALNYKSAGNLRKAIQDVCPKGVDIYFDNVGGEISDAVVPLLNDYSRIPLCGQISLYNDSRIAVGPRLQPYLLTHRTLLQGFIIHDYESRFGEALRELSLWIRENKLKYAETIIDGLENAPKAFLGLFKGENLGKQLVRVEERD